MHNTAVQQSETVPGAVNHVRQPTFAVADVRRVAAAYPCALPAASEYARRFFPKAGSLARAA